MKIRQATRLLGSDNFKKCYEYLKEQRRYSRNGDFDENKIFEGLKKIVSNPADCFLVDQLLFLEET